MEQLPIIVKPQHPCYEQVKTLIEQYDIKHIVAFIGRAGSGKDYQCNLLKEQGYKKLAFADALRDIAFNALNLVHEKDPNFYKSCYDWYKEYDCIVVYDHIGQKNHLNFRRFLELLGTQGIRKYDPDFWCRALINTITKNNYNKICISDMRFINEYESVKQFAENNGYEFEVIFCDYRSNRYQDNNNHESAKMGNYFSTHGYMDLQKLTDNDILKYKNYMKEVKE